MNPFTPKAALRIEALFVLIVACMLYQHLHFSWVVFALFILVPDVSMLGYTVNKTAGTLAYNIAHTYWLPLIWISHIAADRLMVFGIKYTTGFKDTHLQRV